MDGLAASLAPEATVAPEAAAAPAAAADPWAAPALREPVARAACPAAEEAAVELAGDASHIINQSPDLVRHMPSHMKPWIPRHNSQP